MADILRATNNVPGFHQAMKLYLLETSPILREKQKKTLYNYDFNHISSLEQFDVEGPIYILGNEFLDALPIQQFIYQEGCWHEQGISLSQENALQKTCCPANSLKNLCNYPPPQEGDILEYGSAMKEFIEKSGRLIHHHGGAMLWIDYGYFGYVFGETVQAVQAHQPVDIISNPGNSDLTAHINFAYLKDLLEEGGLKVFGPVSQARFLSNLGLHVRADQLKSGANDLQKQDIEQALYRLTDPKEMGALFQVMAAVPHTSAQPEGFT
jgi:SAM-dependent MidA family methyltransferase